MAEEKGFKITIRLRVSLLEVVSPRGQRRGRIKAASDLRWGHPRCIA